MKRLCPGLTALLLAACGSAPPRPDTVRERIGEEVEQAATQRKSRENAERNMLLPPLAVEMPKHENGNGNGSNDRFDLSVVNAPAAQVFMAIVTNTRYNMLVGPEVTGNITISLKDVTVKDALESIRELYGYEFNIKGSRISIQPNTLQTRVFQVNYLAMQRKGDTTLAVGSSSQSSNQTGSSGGASGQSSGGVGGQQTQNVYDPSGSNVKTENNIDFWSELKSALEALVKEGDSTQSGANAPKVVVNKVSGTVVVRARPRDLRLVEEYLDSSKMFVQRQVMLEAKILEVTLKSGSQAGINWGSFNGNNNRFTAGVVQSGTVLRTQPGIPVEMTNQPSVGASDRYDDIFSKEGTFIPGKAGLIAASALGKGFVGLAFQAANFAALLNFLETQGTVSVLSSPRVATLNNQKAVLKVGTDEAYVTGFTMTQSQQNAGTTTTTVAVPTPQTARLFSGISLDVTPQIDEEGNIVLHVHPAISTVREVQKTFNLGTAGVISLPLASRDVNETDNIVRVQDGNIVAIGGMMNQYQVSERSGLPGTLDSKAGIAVGQRDTQLKKSEMVILLKPTLISDDRAWVKDLEQSNERLRKFDLPPLAVPLK